MYKAFFGLRERPFKLVPDPAYLFLGRSHEEALAHLKFAVSRGDGFVEITGEVGTGKTTLCRSFLDSLDERTEAAYIFNPKLDSVQLLKAVNDEFGLPSGSDNIKDLIDGLNSFLMAKKADGKNVLLLIDEAQNLSREVLEQLRLLSNLETSKTKLLQIVLVGQPELGELLDSYELRQLSQRIALSCHLCPFTYRETREYIRHRLRIASQGREIAFSAGAFRTLFRHSKGIPRLINIACDRALLTSFVNGRGKVDGKMARLAVRELTGRRQSQPRRLQRAILSFFCLTALAVLAYFPGKALIQEALWSEEGGMEGSAPPTMAVTSAQDAGAGVDETANDVALPPADLKQWLSEVSAEESRRIALEYVAGRWQVPLLDRGAHLDGLDEVSTFFRLCARRNGLACSRIQADLDLLRRLNLPAILEMRLPEDRSLRYLALSKLHGAEAGLHLKPGREDLATGADELNAYWSGWAVLLWRDFLSFDGAVRLGSKGEAVTALKLFMREIGFEGVPLTPYYDKETREAVKALQESQGLKPDGIVGPLTKIVLYNQKESLGIPHID